MKSLTVTDSVIGIQAFCKKKINNTFFPPKRAKQYVRWLHLVSSKILIGNIFSFLTWTVFLETTGCLFSITEVLFRAVEATVGGGGLGACARSGLSSVPTGNRASSVVRKLTVSTIHCCREGWGFKFKKIYFLVY